MTELKNQKLDLKAVLQNIILCVETLRAEQFENESEIQQAGVATPHTIRCLKCSLTFKSQLNDIGLDSLQSK